MNTPICDFLQKYQSDNFLRLHMPAHKGKLVDNFLSGVYPLDITEICGADSLFEASGIIAESEKNAAALFGTVRTCYSTGGSTLCIQAMLDIMKRDGRNYAIAARNSHRAFLNACTLLGIDIEWIYPDYKNTVISGNLDVSKIEYALKKNKNKAFVYITSPDYLGKTVDIKAVSEICHRYDVPLLVDNAHGACLAFYEENMHPINLGADMCCDSAHKMLPALTGCAYLHIGNEKYAENAKQSMLMFGSTSPSYLMLASLDLCNRYIYENIKDDLRETVASVLKIKSELSDKYVFEYSGEPLHLTLNAAESGISGIELSAYLRINGVECEYSDNEVAVMLFSPVNTAEDIERFKWILSNSDMPKIFRKQSPLKFPVLKKAMSVREAGLSPFETIEISESEGRICGAVDVPCPPAIPIAVSGEVINRECIEIFRRYGIDKIKVVKL